MPEPILLIRKILSRLVCAFHGGLSIDFEQLVKSTLQISALGAVLAQVERPLVGVGGGLALVRPPQQVGAGDVIGIILLHPLDPVQQLQTGGRTLLPSLPPPPG